VKEGTEGGNKKMEKRGGSIQKERRLEGRMDRRNGGNKGRGL
jgi:hypothetical protein